MRALARWCSVAACAAALFFALPALTSPHALAAVPGTPLVPCGGENQKPCGYCDFIALGNNLLQFFVYAAGAIATLLFVYAGILYVTSGPNPGNIEKAHRIFWHVLIGLTITLAAWLIVHTLFVLLARGPNGELQSGLAPWSAIVCEVSGGGAAAAAPRQERDARNQSATPAPPRAEGAVGGGATGAPQIPQPPQAPPRTIAPPREKPSRPASALSHQDALTYLLEREALCRESGGRSYSACIRIPKGASLDGVQVAVLDEVVSWVKSCERAAVAGTGKAFLPQGCTLTLDVRPETVTLQDPRGEIVQTRSGVSWYMARENMDDLLFAYFQENVWNDSRNIRDTTQFNQAPRDRVTRVSDEENMMTVVQVEEGNYFVSVYPPYKEIVPSAIPIASVAQGVYADPPCVAGGTCAPLTEYRMAVGDRACEMRVAGRPCYIQRSLGKRLIPLTETLGERIIVATAFPPNASCEGADGACATPAADACLREGTCIDLRPADGTAAGAAEALLTYLRQWNPTESEKLGVSYRYNPEDPAQRQALEAVTRRIATAYAIPEDGDMALVGALNALLGASEETIIDDRANNAATEEEGIAIIAENIAALMEEKGVIASAATDAPTLRAYCAGMDGVTEDPQCR